MTYDRSAVMRAVKSRDTGPERAVRAMLWPLAPGYRLHRDDLPGKPDIVYASRKLAIFVHGCFWHGHDCPRGARMPKANADYWAAKIARNRARDERTLAAYPAHGLARACRLRMRTEGSGLARGAPRRGAAVGAVADRAYLMMAAQRHCRRGLAGPISQGGPAYGNRAGVL